MAADNADLDELIRALRAYTEPPSEALVALVRKCTTERETGVYPWMTPLVSTSN
ncbi:MAG: hypothetical protein JWM46_346 [Candidatus Kaiserbacteria bacterium]|nr:hypothetical protein [Candidatus Kaiserbacteria bacterium]